MGISKIAVNFEIAANPKVIPTKNKLTLLGSVRNLLN